MRNEAFTESGYYNNLYDEIAHMERKAAHALDNYGMDMSKELEAALQGLRAATEAALKQMQEERRV